MRIGLYIKWKQGSLTPKTNVLGDELFGNSMCKSLLKNDNVESCELYNTTNHPINRLDVMIYLNDIPPNKDWAKKHILYLQNGYGNGSASVLKELQKNNYDGYAFISNTLLRTHKENCFDGIYLPFGVDIEEFYPHHPSMIFDYDVAYVGNDIKGIERSNRYLLPATQFNFGMFGNWDIPHHDIALWRNLKKYPPYRKAFARISQGKIPQAKVPILYSSAKININCTIQDCIDWDVITLRTYEVLACKGFLISDKVPSAERTLLNGVVFTDGYTDLTDKIKYYLEHPKERKKTAETGYNYVINNASIDKRMKELLSYTEDII
jgi:spore maturation protein CgeB